MNQILPQNQSRYRMVSYDEASPEVQTIYDDTKKTLQLPFVLNWFKCQGDNATLLKGNWSKLKNTLMEGEVPNVLKQLIIYNVSKERGCNYCSHAHGIFADSMSSMISEDEGFKATQHINSPSMPVSYRTAVQIVTKAALNHSDISDEDFNSLEKAGFYKERNPGAYGSGRPGKHAEYDCRCIWNKDRQRTFRNSGIRVSFYDAGH